MPLRGSLHRISYRAENGERRAQAWYIVGGAAINVAGEIGGGDGFSRCPWDAAWKAARDMRRFLERGRRIVGRGAV